MLPNFVLQSLGGIHDDPVRLRFVTAPVLVKHIFYAKH